MLTWGDLSALLSRVGCRSSISHMPGTVGQELAPAHEPATHAHHHREPALPRSRQHDPDDSTPVVNLSHYWSGFVGGRRSTEANADDMPVEIPVSFARKFGEWCAEHGVRGKFSFVPMPGGLGTIDLGLPGFSKAHLDEWIRAAKELIWPTRLHP